MSTVTLLLAMACVRDGSDPSGAPEPATTDSDWDGGDTAIDSPPDTTPTDADGDGFSGQDDCDDGDPAVHPGAVDVCNEMDDDCDGEVDEDAPEWHVDADGDGYGDSATVRACEQPAQAASEGGDCDDGDADVHPQAVDWCGDGVDQDCAEGDAECAPVVEAESLGTVILGDDPDYYIGSLGQFGVGDLTGDGLDDVVIGAPEWSVPRLEGRADVMMSPISSATSTGSAIAELRCGDLYGDNCGIGVAVVGDVNGDGWNEVAVGNPAYWSKSAAVLFSPPIAGTMDIDAAVTTWTANTQNSFGEDIVGGDLDGDGLADVVFGDGSHDSGYAAALIFFSPAPGAMTADDADARLFGEGHDPPVWTRYLSVGGDVDGDGYRDLVVGRVANDAYALLSGSVYLFRGPFDGDRSPEEADALVLGTETAQGVGISASICGDQDGDGRDEVVIGDSAEDSLGLDILRGPLSGTYLVPDASDARIVSTDNDAYLGARHECLGDLDGDGTGDLAVAAKGKDANGIDSGSVYVFFGPIVGLLDGGAADLELRGAAGDLLGANTGHGDVDGDGVNDLLIGASGHADAGAVYIVTGARLLTASGR